MRTILTALTVALAATVAAPAARAEPMTLAYQAVMHVAESYAMPLLGNDRHVVGTAAFQGLALLEGGDDVAMHRYAGWFEIEGEAGRFHGALDFSFGDGATLTAAYEGVIDTVSETDFEFSATVRDVTGTGRFAGVTGEGTFSGRRYGPIAQGGLTHVSGALELTPSQ